MISEPLDFYHFDILGHGPQKFVMGRPHKWSMSSQRKIDLKVYGGEA